MNHTLSRLTFYEKNQQHNAIVKWLHSFRYKHIISVIEKLEKTLPDRPIRITELGCAHAKLFDLLNSQFTINYTGVDICDTFLTAANERYQSHANFRTIHGSATDKTLLCTEDQPDIIIALETLEHIPETDVVRIIENVASISPALFVCSVPVEIGPAIWLKNIGSMLTGYIRHKEYTWTETFWAGLYQLDRLPPHDTGHKGFDWRWLAQTLRQNLKIKQIRRFPCKLLPAALSTSVFFITQPRVKLTRKSNQPTQSSG